MMAGLKSKNQNEKFNAVKIWRIIVYSFFLLLIFFLLTVSYLKLGVNITIVTPHIKAGRSKCYNVSDSPFEEYTARIKLVRERVLQSVRNATSFDKKTYVIKKNNIISPIWNKNYFQSIENLTSVATVSYSCNMDNQSLSHASKCGIKQPRVFYRWSVDPQLCKINHTWVDQNICVEHAEKEVTWRTDDYSFSKSPEIDFFLHIITNGVIDTIGCVASDNKVIVPNSCHAFSVKDVMKGSSGKIPFYEEVFVISQYWGSAFFHSSIECIPRLAAYLDFLKQFPHIKIHIQQISSTYRAYFSVLGLDFERVVSGVVRGGVVYFPQGGGCGNLHQPGGQVMANYYHSFIKKKLECELRHHYKESRSINDITFNDTAISNIRNIIVLIQRTGRTRKLKQHQNIAKQLHRIAEKNHLKFIIFAGDAIPAIEETMKIFYNAVLIVAPHGAGLSNVIFSQAGTIVIEVICKSYPNMCFRDMSYKLGMRYHSVVSTTENCEWMTVDVQGLVIKVKKLLQYFTEFG